MAAIGLTLTSVLLYGMWGTLSKRALEDLSWPQLSMIYGAAIIVVTGVIYGAGYSAHGWALRGVGIGIATAVAGAVGLVALYLGLDRGKASVVLPVFALFPIVTVALSMLFFGERVSGTQLLGISLAVVAVILVSLG